MSFMLAEIATTAYYAIAAAIAIFTGVGAAIAMGLATSKALESIARQPEAESKIRTALMMGLAFTETTAIYGLLIAIFLVTKL